MNRLGLHTAAVGCWLLGSGLVSGHEPAATHDSPQTSATRVVLAIATDPRNRPIVDVGPDDFAVTEAGSAREVLSVRIADYPIVVAVDTRSRTKADFATIQQAARHFVDRIGADRPVVVATLGRSPKTIATFDDSRTTVLDRLAALSPDAEGESSQLLDGITAAARMLKANEPLFSAIVVLSSAPGAPGERREDDPVTTILGSGAIVHAIVNQAGGTAGMQPFRALVMQTRGEITAIYSAASYSAALDRLAARLSSELLIEYISPAGPRATDVKVGIRIPGARVRGLGVAPQ